MTDLLPGRLALLDHLTGVLPFASAQATTLVLIGIVHTEDGALPPVAVLARTTRLIASSLRGDDWLGRSGPGEVAAVLAGTAEDAHSAAARVLDGIATLGVPDLAAAAGIVVLSADLTGEQALQRAAAALDDARSRTRGRIVLTAG
ncbi:hypothetical protein GB931_08140 [Modestobacter sp. I12A-02628]|uniref:GGDEF domain-containing protein n=1 Tax=Goekera deserti TaxID=2497753 RepID=A0A7K3WFA3_9ACTN|nr:hypothetical protein [Goekera deserti]MPQ97893.1 hypothetical protein [Goekera deserti]NDI48539.1 hypothetical protein [Goekera deserti]NEL55082.1 hypothetical protein [Goekera deserti]